MGISAHNAVSPNTSGRSQPGLGPGTPVRRCGSGSVSPRGSVGGLRHHPGRVPAHAVRGNPGIPGGGSPGTPERVLGRQTQTLVFRVKNQVLLNLAQCTREWRVCRADAPRSEQKPHKTRQKKKKKKKETSKEKIFFPFQKKNGFFLRPYSRSSRLRGLG